MSYRGTLLFKPYRIDSGPGSSVGIATDYGLDGPGSNPENAANWKRIQNHIARMLRVAPKNIPHEWLIRPQMNLWPPQRQRAVLWLLARYVSFTTERRRSQNPLELMDFLKRSRWKLYQRSHRKKQVANFLMVLDMPQ